jgi:hypothetical protein
MAAPPIEVSPSKKSSSGTAILFVREGVTTGAVKS